MQQPAQKKKTEPVNIPAQPPAANEAFQTAGKDIFDKDVLEKPILNDLGNTALAQQQMDALAEQHDTVMEELTERSTIDENVQTCLTSVEQVGLMAGRVANKDVTMQEVRILVNSLMPEDKAEAENFVTQIHRLKDAAAMAASHAQEAMWGRQKR